MEYYAAMKKNKIMPFTAWMDLEIIILSEVSQTKTNIIWYDITYAVSKKMIPMNLFEVKWKLLSHVQLFTTPYYTVHGIL